MNMRGQRVVSFSSVFAAIVVASFDRLAAVVSSVISKNGFDVSKVPLLLGLIIVIGLVSWLLEYGIRHGIPRLYRKLRNIDDVDYMNGQLQAARKALIAEVGALKDKKDSFEKNVDTAVELIDSLNAVNVNVGERKQQARTSVISLKREYAENIKDLKRSIDTIHQHLNEAQGIFEDEEWGRDAAARMYRNRQKPHR